MLELDANELAQCLTQGSKWKHKPEDISWLTRKEILDAIREGVRLVQLKQSEDE